MTEDASAQSEAAEAAIQLRRSLRWNAVAALSVLFGVLLLFAAPLRSLSGVLAAVALLMSAVVAYYSLRVRFDAMVFERWSRRSDVEAAMREFDAMLAHRFRRPLPVSARPMTERVEGASLLARRRRGWCATQAAAILAAAAVWAANGT